MDLQGRRAKIFYNDGQAVQVRIGTISSEDAVFFVIENAVLIPKDKIIRIEVLA